MARYIDADALVQNIVNTPTQALDDIDFCHPDALTGLANRQNEIIDMIGEMPTADVAPVRHGEWLNANHTRIVTCSLCGGTVQTNWRGFYCQNCGAKMDGGTDNG